SLVAISIVILLCRRYSWPPNKLLPVAICSRVEAGLPRGVELVHRLHFSALDDLRVPPLHLVDVLQKRLSHAATQDFWVHDIEFPRAPAVVLDIPAVARVRALGGEARQVRGIGHDEGDALHMPEASVAVEASRQIDLAHVHAARVPVAYIEGDGFL